MTTVYGLVLSPHIIVSEYGMDKILFSLTGYYSS